jgi:L-ribulose-5-phosphate 4-epimerase
VTAPTAPTGRRPAVIPAVSEELRHEVLEANLRIPRAGLATLTWGNVSGVDREALILTNIPQPVDHLLLPKP